VKNIPTPVHAFMVAMRRQDGTYATPQVKKPVKASGPPNWMWPVAVTLVCLTAIGVGGFLYFTKLETSAPTATSTASNSTAPSATPTTVPTPVATATPTPAPTLAPKAEAPAPPPSPPPITSGEKFAATSVPFISDRTRATLASDYAPVGDFKAFSLNIGGFTGFVTGQSNEEAAKIGAVEQCQKRADAAGSPRKCELYAVGNTVVYAHGKPPVPPLPWIRHDQATDRPFAPKDVPLLRDTSKTRLENVYVPARKTKALALGPGGGQYFMTLGTEAVEEAARRSLESCGAIYGVPCMIVALDDDFVVPIPTTMKVIGFFRVADSPLIAPEARGDASRKLADAPSGWNAVAVGAARRPGLAVKHASEQTAVNEALSECVKRDSDCRVVAIGPFTVGPN
jgi:hypothetical protein